MLDSGHQDSEVVRGDGSYPSKPYVGNGTATVEVSLRFEDTVWGETHEYNEFGFLRFKEKTSHE
jgi:hypothetical protein